MDDGAEVRFPFLLLAVLMVGLGGVTAMREIAVHNELSATTFWIGVVVFGAGAGVAGAAFSVRFTAWKQVRSAAGKSSWWEKLP